MTLLGLALGSGCSAPCRHFDFHQVSPGIYVGCRPRHTEDFAALHQCGIHTILSLETCLWHVKPERKAAARHQITFCNVPILASPFGPTERSVKEALLRLKDPTLRPVYIHCLYGRDRTAVILALYRVYCQEWSPGMAWSELIHSGYNDTWSLWGFKHYFWHHTRPPEWAMPQRAADVRPAAAKAARPP